MGWSEEFRFRDCGWCHLRDAELTVVWGPAHLTRTAAQGERWWTGVSCSRCGGVTLIETTHPDLGPGLVRTIPEDAGAELQINHLPNDVKKYYEAARRAMDAGLPDSAAVQLRRTLEAAAASVGAEGKTLATAVKNMIAAGLVTKEFGKAVDHIRKIGNLGAHHTDEDMTTEEAIRAQQFTAQVLRNLFEIPGELALLENDGTGDEPPEQT